MVLYNVVSKEAPGPRESIVGVRCHGTMTQEMQSKVPNMVQLSNHANLDWSANKKWCIEFFLASTRAQGLMETKELFWKTLW